MQKLATAAAMLSTAARADDLVVHGAGSLREAVGQIAAEFGQAHGLAVATQFGPSSRSVTLRHDDRRPPFEGGHPLIPGTPPAPYAAP